MSGVEGSDVAGDGGAADGTGALARVGGTGEPSAGASDALGGGADSDPGDSSVHPHLPVTHHPALKEALEKERSGANSVSGACVHMSKNCSEGSLIASAVGLPTTEEQNRRGILVGPPLTEYEKVRSYIRSPIFQLIRKAPNQRILDTLNMMLHRFVKVLNTFV